MIGVISIRTADEIYILAKNKTEPHDLLELHLYLTFKDLIHMYKTKQVDEVQASRLKNKLYNRYDSEKAIWESRQKLYGKVIEDIKKTELLRAQLRKNKTFENAMLLINAYSGERWE